MKTKNAIYGILFLGVLCLAFTSCKQKDKTGSTAKTAVEYDEPTSSLPLNRLRLPEGFEIEVYASNIDGARSMAMGDDGTLFVGTRTENLVYAVQDRDNDFRADTIMVLDSLDVPNGIAYKNGALYVAQVGRLLRYDNIEKNLENPEPTTVYDDYPTEFHHGWKYITFGPDDKLYVPVGAPCNICDSTVVDKRYATITRMDADGSNREIVAHGSHLASRYR